MNATLVENIITAFKKKIEATPTLVNAPG